MKVRSYTELCSFKTLYERYEYLKLDGIVGSETFGSERYLNQLFYRSLEWKKIRSQVITRDNGCELGLDGYEISGKIIIHHINPIFVEDLREANSFLLDLDNLVCVSESMHNAIHYGDDSVLRRYEYKPRTANDTTLWRRTA